jgi:hypothetical protein
MLCSSIRSLTPNNSALVDCVQIFAYVVVLHLATDVKDHSGLTKVALYFVSTARLVVGQEYRWVSRCLPIDYGLHALCFAARMAGPLLAQLRVGVWALCVPRLSLRGKVN